MMLRQKSLAFVALFALAFSASSLLRADDGIPLPVLPPKKPPAATTPAEPQPDPDFKPVTLIPQPCTLAYGEDKDGTPSTDSNGKPVHVGGGNFVDVLNSLAVAIRDSNTPGTGPGGSKETQNNQGYAVLQLLCSAQLQKFSGKYILIVNASEQGWSVDPDMKPASKQQCAVDRSNIEKSLTNYKAPLTDQEAADYAAGKDVAFTIDLPFSQLTKLAGDHPKFDLKQKLLVQSGSVPGANDDDVP